MPAVGPGPSMKSRRYRRWENLIYAEPKRSEISALGTNSILAESKMSTATTNPPTKRRKCLPQPTHPRSAGNFGDGNRLIHGEPKSSAVGTSSVLAAPKYLRRQPNRLRIAGNAGGENQLLHEGPEISAVGKTPFTPSRKFRRWEQIHPRRAGNIGAGEELHTRRAEYFGGDKPTHP